MFDIAVAAPPPLLALIELACVDWYPVVLWLLYLSMLNVSKSV